MAVNRDWVADAYGCVPDYGRLPLSEVKEMGYTFADMLFAEAALMELWLIVWEPGP